MAHTLTQQRNVEHNVEHIGRLVLGIALCLELVYACIGITATVGNLLDSLALRPDIPFYQIGEAWKALPPGQATGIIIMAGATGALALVELCKIPLAYGAYLANRLVWKLVFSAGILGIVLITFENFVGALERSFDVQTRPITEARQQLNQVGQRIAHLEREASEAPTIKEDESLRDHEALENAVTARIRQELLALTARYEAEQRRLWTQTPAEEPVEIADVRRAISSLGSDRDRRAQLLSSRQTALEDLRRARAEEHAANDAWYDQRHDGARSQGQYRVSASVLNVRDGPGIRFNLVSRLYAGETVLVGKQDGNWGQVVEDGTWVNFGHLNPLPALWIENNEELIQQYDANRAEIDARFDAREEEERKRYNQMLETELQDYADRHAALIQRQETLEEARARAIEARNSELAMLSTAYARDVEAIEAEGSAEIAMLRNDLEAKRAAWAQLAGANKKRTETIRALQTDYMELGAELTKLTNGNQIVRLARKVYAHEDATAITQAQMTTVIGIVTVTLAGFIAVSPVLLSFVGIVLLYQPSRATFAKMRRRSAMGGLAAALRRYLIARRRSLRRAPKTIVKWFPETARAGDVS